MSLLPSQDFLYFQSKAHHYRKLVQAKSNINSIHRTMEVVRNNRDVSFKRKHEIDEENTGLTKRIIGIATGKHHALQQSGHYSRFNQFQRRFRRQSNKSSQQREVVRENQILTDKIVRAKARVGSVVDWKKQFQHKEKQRRHMSRYDQGNNSKRDLRISENSFLPVSYKSYLEGIHLESFSDGKKMQKLQIQQLFILPSILKTERTLTQSKLQDKYLINNGEQISN